MHAPVKTSSRGGSYVFLGGFLKSSLIETLSSYSNKTSYNSVPLEFYMEFRPIAGKTAD